MSLQHTEPQELALLRSRHRAFRLVDLISSDRRRLIGVGMVTLLDIGAAVDELRRCISTLGFKGVYLRPNPVGGRALHDQSEASRAAADGGESRPAQFVLRQRIATSSGDLPYHRRRRDSASDGSNM